MMDGYKPPESHSGAPRAHGSFPSSAYSGRNGFAADGKFIFAELVIYLAGQEDQCWEKIGVVWGSHRKSAASHRKAPGYGEYATPFFPHHPREVPAIRKVNGRLNREAFKEAARTGVIDFSGLDQFSIFIIQHINE